MKHHYFKIVFSVVLAFVLNACYAQPLVIKSNDAHIRYIGRIGTTDSAAVLYWSATSVKINFKGTGLKALLRDEAGNNFYNVIVDGKLSSILHLKQGKEEYILAEGLNANEHSIELFKRTEWEMGRTWLYSISLNDKGKLLPAPKAKQRKMEFFGNSITCGYAVEDTTGQDRGTAPFENAYVSYAAITACHFNADYHSTSKSGIGVVISWFPLIMPEMYDRLDARDPNSKWDFSKYTPDVVVVNLFQNDSWLTLNTAHEQFKARFGTKAPEPAFIINAYSNFIKSVRAKYPKASIICALGNMDATKAGSPWPGYIEKAVAGLNDRKIYIHFFPYKNTPGHPSVAEQKVMADDLIAFIDKNIKW